MMRKQKERLFKKFQALCQNSEFLSAIRASDRKSFMIRYMMTDEMLEEVLNADKDKGKKL